MYQQNNYSIYLPTLTKINKYLIIFCVVIFLLQSLFSMFDTGIGISNLFGLSYSLFKSGYIFQVLTYPFVQGDFLSLVFNAMVLWFIGSELEKNWGTFFYSGLLIFSILSAAFVYLLVVMLFFSKNLIISSVPMLGITGICSSLLLIYSLVYGERILSFMLFFPMKARYFCWILLAMELYMGVFSSYSKAYWGHLGAMLGGFLFLKYSIYITRSILWLLKRFFLKSASASSSSKRSFAKSNKGKSHLRLVKNNEDDDVNDNESDSSSGPKYWQ